MATFEWAIIKPSGKLMDALLTDLLNQVMMPLKWLFGHVWVAPFFMFLPMLLIAAWMIYRAEKETQPYLKSAEKCADTIATALGADADPSAERLAFSHNFDQVVSAFAESDRDTQLLQAWREFHETIVDESASPIQNTSRPFTFFQRVEPKQDQLSFWSNAFVGIGLVLTFVGLIVALSIAAENMPNNNPGQVSDPVKALTGLLTVAGAKFFTSIGGILASLMLRFAESGLTKRTKRATREICELLERGLVYIPPQRLAAQQLEELKEQTAQIKNFNQDIAFQIADRINAGVTLGVTTAFEPIANSISAMGQSITEVTAGIGEGTAVAIAQVSGAQLKALSETLAALTEKLDSISTGVAASGDEAARQIREAGADFRLAASDIKGAFEVLTVNVGELGPKMIETANAASSAQLDALTKVLSGIEESQARAAKSIEDAVGALLVATEKAARVLATAVEVEIEGGVKEIGEVFGTVLGQSGEAMRLASLNLAEAIEGASSQVRLASDGFVKSGESAVSSSEAMMEVSGEVRNTVRQIADAGREFASIAGPALAASQSVKEAANRIAQAIQDGRGAEEGVLDELKKLAREISQTQAAATNAWTDYRNRFEGVDKSLANTTALLSETLGASLGDFRTFAQKFDSEMADAISKLAGPLSSIEDYAGSLDEFVEAQRTAVRRS